MAITISNVYIQTFEQNLRHLAQQSDTRLRAHVSERATGGQNHNWERMASSDAVEKTTALQATPDVEPVWSRRVSTAETWNWAASSEQEDIVQMLVDPNSNLNHSGAMAMRRAVDDLIIAAAIGASLDGTGTPVAFDTTNQKIGDGSTEITLDNVLEVQEIFNSNDVDPDEAKCFVIGPTQQRKLLQLMEVTSGDYQSMKALATGVLPNWMGFTWIVSNRLSSQGAGQIDCFAMSTKGIGLQVNRDISAKVAEDPSVSFAWRIYLFMTMGAIRVEDEHVVWLEVADTVT